jgi:hypothetical protein
MSLPEPEEVLFREVQQFRQPWLWAVVLAWPAIMLLVFGYGLFRQAVLGQPWGSSPMPTDALALATCVPTVVLLCFAWLFYAVKLITEVRRDGLYIRFWPLAWRRIGYDQIIECEARVYHPIREYGGWGIRWGL